MIISRPILRLQHFKIVITFFVLSLAVVILSSPSFATTPTFTAEELAWIEANPIIHYAPDRNFVPFEYETESKFEGLALDYLSKISEISGLKFENVYYEKWSEAFDDAVRGKVDLIFATPSDTRALYLNFSQTIITAPLAIVVRDQAPDYLTMNDLKTWRIAAVEGYITIEELLRQYPEYQIVTYPNVDSAMKATSFGEADAFIINIGSATAAIEKHQLLNLKVAGETTFSSSLAYAGRKDWPMLISIINKSLATMDMSTRQQINQNWIKLQIVPLWKNKGVWHISGLILLIFAVTIIWIWLLHRLVNRRTQALQTTKNTLGEIIDHVPHLIFVKDYQGHFIIANKATADFYATDTQQLLGKTHLDLMRDYSLAGVQNHEMLLTRDRQIIESGKEVVIEVEKSIKPNGEVRYYSVNKRAIHLHHQDNSLPSALTVAVDITSEIEAKHMFSSQENALKQAEYQLADLEKKATLGSLVGGITHEINNPIGISVTALSHLIEEVSAFKEVVQSNHLTREALNEHLEDTDEALSILNTNILRAVDMISSFKKMSVDQLSGARTTFNLCETLEHVIHSLKHEFKRNAHSVDYQCNGPLILDSYPGSYSQIMTNLMMNSLIHGFENRSKGLVEIQVTHTANEVCIDYRDNGIGMTPDQLDKAWQPYFTTKRDRGGSGLGMQVIYNTVVRTLNGTITFTSELNCGIQCVMRIPIENKIKKD